MSLKIAVPSKGRLMEKTFDWFSARGLDMGRAGSDRQYAAQADVDGIEPVLLSAGEIPRELAAGRVHLGVTGTDMVREKLAGWERSVEEVAALGFGGADLVIAVPAAWVDVETLDDLDAVAADPRSPRDAITDRNEIPPSGARVPGPCRCRRLPTGRQSRRDRRHGFK